MSTTRNPQALTVLIALSTLIAVATACGGGGGSGSDPTPTPTNTVTPTPTAPTSTSTPTNTPAPAGTATPTGSPPPGGSYNPLKVGNTWSYRETDTGGANPGAVSTETAVTEFLGDIGGSKAGTTAFRIRYTNASTGAYKIEWEENRGVIVLRHLEQKYDSNDALKVTSYYTPSKVRVDMQPDHLVAGATYTEQYSVADTPFGGSTTTTTHTVNWTVEKVDEVITVPAGTFTCLRLRRYSTGGGATPSDKTYWFSQGIGKVKTDEPGVQIEELTSYTLP